MFKECDKTLSCILFKISLSFLSPSSDLTFLAVLTEKAPGTSYNDITLGHLFITWILPLEFKAVAHIDFIFHGLLRLLCFSVLNPRTAHF